MYVILIEKYIKLLYNIINIYFYNLYRSVEMEILSYLIDDDKKEYKCFNTLKDLIISNNDFKEKLEEGYFTGKVEAFGKEEWEKIAKQNVRRIKSFTDVFVDGANIGYCTVASKQLSYSFSGCQICGGVVPILAGTKNCDDGSHTWMVYNGKIYDTTLMIIIDEKFAKEQFGYVEENRYDPNCDAYYSAAKEFTLDENLRKSSHK